MRRKRRLPGSGSIIRAILFLVCGYGVVAGLSTFLSEVIGSSDNGMLFLASLSVTGLSLAGINRLNQTAPAKGDDLPLASPDALVYPGRRGPPRQKATTAILAVIAACATFAGLVVTATSQSGGHADFVRLEDGLMVFFSSAWILVLLLKAWERSGRRP